MHVNLGILLLMSGMAYNVARTSFLLFKRAQEEGTDTDIKSSVLTMICFLMLLFGILLFYVLANQQEDVPDVWIIPVFFTWPLLISYPLALFRLLPKAMVLGRWLPRQESVEDRQRGLRLAATSAALGLCPSVVMCVVLLFERPLPLLAIGYLSLFSTLQGFLLRSVKHAFTASNQSAGILKHILIGMIGSLLFILVMLAVGGAGL
jgi:hypothetical protein